MELIYIFQNQKKLSRGSTYPLLQMADRFLNFEEFVGIDFIRLMCAVKFSLSAMA